MESNSNQILLFYLYEVYYILKVLFKYTHSHSTTLLLYCEYKTIKQKNLHHKKLCTKGGKNLGAAVLDLKKVK